MIAQFFDMEWYGVDKQGNIAVFCSAGTAILPTFVYQDEKRAYTLIEYFDGIPRTTTTILRFPNTKMERAQQIAKEFSDKGLYYFDADDGLTLEISNLHKYYTKHSYPQKPLQFATLPDDIKKLLDNQRMEIEDFALVNTIHIDCNE